MNKDKFIECGYMMIDAHDEYYDEIEAAWTKYLARIAALDKRYKAKLFTEQTIEETRSMLRFGETNLAAELYTDDDAIVYSNVIYLFIGEYESKYGIRLYWLLDKHRGSRAPQRALGDLLYKYFYLPHGYHLQ